MEIFDPFDPVARQALLRSHPLVTNDYLTATPSLPPVLKEVQHAVMLHKKSLCFKALPQMGKTTACKFSAASLADNSDFSDRYVLIVSADPSSRDNVIMTLADELGISRSKSYGFDSKRQEVVDTIDTKLRNIRGRHFVLFIDEIQALKISDFENLQFVQNSLALRNISMTCIGYGQTQIDSLITVLRKQGRPELLVRFFNQIIDLPCCTDSSWVRQVLSVFDEHLLYPADSNCTYTKFFLPQAFETGFRLAKYSDEIYSVLLQRVKDHGLPAMPTAHILETFRLLLIQVRQSDSPSFELRKHLIIDAVIESQIDQYANNLKVN